MTLNMWEIGTSRKYGTGWEEEIFHQPPSTCFHQLLRLLTTWDFAHGNAMMQQTEKRKTQSFNSFLSHSIHTAQLEGHQHIVKHSHFSLWFLRSFSLDSSYSRHFWGCWGRECVHTDSPTTLGSERAEGESSVTSHLHNSTHRALYKGKEVP